MNFKHFKRDFNKWSLLAITISVFISIPIFSIIINVFFGKGEMWNHIVSYFLLDYISNSFCLLLGCGVLTIFFGVLSAWIVSNYNFRFKKWIEWLLFMPIAIPSYITAYCYVGFFGNGGTFISFLKYFGIKFQKIDMMNIYGLIWVLSFSLYPYVYAASRALFKSYPNSIRESAAILGASETRYFLKVGLPLGFPAIIGGSLLVIMEVLNDYGAAKYYGINTFTTGIFRTWTALEDLQSAIYLSGILVIIVFSILSLISWQRSRKSYELNLKAETQKELAVKKISRIKRTACLLFTFLPVLFGLVIPLTQLFIWATQTYKEIFNSSLFYIAFQSIGVALLTAFLIVLFAICITYFKSWSHLKSTTFFTKIATIGYVIPGAIIGIGVIRSSQLIIDFFFINFNLKIGYLFYSTSIILIYAYIFRFLAVGYNIVESNSIKIGRKLSESSYLLGLSRIRTFLKIDLPLLKTTLISAFILVFIDTLKELPLTLILKPYNLQTLAVKAYEYAEDERVAESAIPSLLIIVIIGLLISFINIKEKYNEHS